MSGETQHKRRENPPRNTTNKKRSVEVSMHGVRSMNRVERITVYLGKKDVNTEQRHDETDVLKIANSYVQF